MRTLIALLLPTALTLSFALPEPRGGLAAGRAGERLIDALVAAPRLTAYTEDGAADASVIEVFVEDGVNVLRGAPEVRDIIALGPGAIPLLVKHLDDTRLTSATFAGRPDFRRARVPVGYVCLDILLGVVERSETVFILEDCCDDGLGANVESDFYFRPDEYERSGDGLVVREHVRVVKSNWSRAVRGRLIKFSPPEGRK
jgi:hypothetical protein